MEDLARKWLCAAETEAVEDDLKKLVEETKMPLEKLAVRPRPAPRAVRVRSACPCGGVPRLARAPRRRRHAQGKEGLRMGPYQLVLWQPRYVFADLTGLHYQKLSTQNRPMGKPKKITFASILVCRKVATSPPVLAQRDRALGSLAPRPPLLRAARRAPARRR